MKKWWLRIALIVFALVVAGLAFVWIYLDTIAERAIERVGPAITKTDVDLAGVRLSPFSGKGELKGLVVANPEGFKSPAAIQAGSIAIHIEPGSILGDKTIIRSVTLLGPEITFEGGFAGNNLSKLLDNVNETAAKPSATTETEAKAKTRKLQVDEVRITRAKVHLAATLLAGQGVTVPLPEIHLTGLGQGPDGITPAELTQRVLRAVLEATVQALSGAGGDVTKALQGMGGGAPESIEKAARGIGDLLKKKE